MTPRTGAHIYLHDKTRLAKNPLGHINYAMPPKPTPLPKVGARVRKKFGKTWYAGKVTEATKGDRYPITVKFDDGDVETCTMRQFQSQFETINDTSVAGKKRKAAEKEKDKKKTAPAAKKMKKEASLAPGMVLVEKRPYRAHGYAPTLIDREKTITFKQHLDCVWAVVQDAWTKLCDDVDVPANEPARTHLYRPGRIMCYSEPELWEEMLWEDGGHDGSDDVDDLYFNRQQTCESARDFAANFLGMSLNLSHYEGEEHVVGKSDCPKGWSESKRDKYAKAFDAITRKLNEVKEDGNSWSLIPHLWDERTRVIEQTVDRVGKFAKV